MLLFTLATQLTYSAYEVIVPQNDNPTRMKVVKFLNEQTTPSDNVLIWGAEATVYVQAGIKAPVQDVLLYHAFTKDFNKTALINQLILDIKTKRPRYIIDASISEPNIPPLDHEKRKLWKAENRNYGIDPPHYSLFAYIEQNYTFRGSFGDKPWVIYERKR